MKKNNLRHLTTSFAAASLLVCSQSHALGIGEMKLQSALNQTLQAEIGLVLSEGEKATDFKIALAPNAKFDEAGIPWTLFLSKIKFQPVTQNGKTVIKLTSNEVLKEPFLDFLLEIKWAKGSLYREFTVLVDPPAAYQLPQTIDSPKQILETQSNEPLRFITAPANPMMSEVTYGPIRENETLWNIAAQFNKQNNVSVNRMLAAISIANPDAFLSRQTNSLIAGKTLKIPSFVESPKFFDATKKAHSKQSVSVVKTVVKAKITTPKEKTVANPLATVNASVKTETDSSKKVVELEKQLSAMQKMIAEKDAQMVALKSPVVVSPIVKPVVPTPIQPAPISTVTPPVLPIVPIINTPTTPVAVMPPPALPIIATPPPIVAPVDTSLPAVVANYWGIPTDMYYYVAGSVGSLLLSVLVLLRLRQRKTEQEFVVESPVTAENVAETQEEKAEYAIETAAASKNDIAMFDAEEFDVNDAMFEENALAGFADIVKTDLSKHDASDVLFKVDVYCTYGNTEKAEQLLLAEFTKDSTRHDYAIRLLKLYQADDNKAAFKDFIFELAKLEKNDLPDFWTQVSDLAAEFYPEALFFMPPPAMPNPSATSTNEMLSSVDMTMKFDDDLDFDSMRFDEPDDEEIIFGELKLEDTLNGATADFPELSKQFDDKKSSIDFGDFETGELLKAETVSAHESMPELDFGLNFASFETVEPETVAATELKEELDFGLDFGSFEIAEPETVARAELKEELDFGLDFGSFEAPKPEIVAATELKEELDFGLNFGSFETVEPETVAATELKEELDFGLNFGSFETPKPEPTKFESIVNLEKSDFSEKHEHVKSSVNFDKVSDLINEKVVEAHSNLAKLYEEEKQDSTLDYLDMSDSEFAASLAIEVLRKCEIKEQLCRQKIAQEVLNKLR